MVRVLHTVLLFPTVQRLQCWSLFEGQGCQDSEQVPHQVAMQGSRSTEDQVWIMKSEVAKVLQAFPRKISRSNHEKPYTTIQKHQVFGPKPIDSPPPGISSRNHTAQGMKPGMSPQPPVASS